MNKTIGIILPASKMEETVISAGMQRLSELGWSAKIFGNRHTSVGRLSAPDSDRAESIMAAFRDSDVQAIICGRGGYGSARVESYLNPREILSHDKYFVGYSDITHLHHHLFKMGCRKLIHGPMITDFAKKGDRVSCEALIEMIEGRWSSYSLHNDDFGICVGNRGKATGRLIGGNLAVLTATIGTSAAIVPDGDILFFEDIGEPIYRYDRCLNHLKRAGYFEKLSAVVVGETTYTDTSNDLTVGRTWHELVQEYVPSGVPFVTNFPCGHGRSQLSIPFGRNVEITISNQTTRIAAV